MRTRTCNTALAVLAAGLWFGGPADLHAQVAPEVGVVRITDSPAAGNVSPVSHHECAPGECQHGEIVYVGPAEFHGDCHECGGHCREGGCVRCGKKCCYCYRRYREMLTYPAPVKVPIHRRPVTYDNFYPNPWYGDDRGNVAGNAPMTYTPTDTTQMGYYYQKTPMWLPRPGQLPNPPWPPNWIARERQFDAPVALHRTWPPHDPWSNCRLPWHAAHGRYHGPAFSAEGGYGPGCPVIVEEPVSGGSDPEPAPEPMPEGDDESISPPPAPSAE